MNRPATLLVLLLAGLLAGCGGGSRPTGIRAAETPADDVAEYQPRWRSHTVDSTQYRKVFLAGTIDMGRSSDWQAALVARFRDSIGGRWLFFNPRRREFHASPAEMEYQVAWELAHLEAADLIVMNLLGDSRSPLLFVLVACLVNVAGDLLLVAGLGMDAAVVHSGFAYLKGFAPETIMTVELFSMVGYFNGRPRRPVLCRHIVASAPSLCSARIFFHKIPPIGNRC